MSADKYSYAVQLMYEYNRNPHFKTNRTGVLLIASMGKMPNYKNKNLNMLGLAVFQMREYITKRDYSDLSAIRVAARIAERGRGIVITDIEIGPHDLLSLFIDILLDLKRYDINDSTFFPERIKVVADIIFPPKGSRIQYT